MSPRASAPFHVMQVLPALGHGGVERGTVEVAKALVDAGWRSSVVSAGGPLAESMRGTRHFTLPVGEKSLLTWRCVRALRVLLASERPDVLHLRSRLPAWVAYLAWRGLPERARPRLVTTVHGLYSVSRYSAVMLKGERIIAVSVAVRDYLDAHYRGRFDPERVRVIPRGVDVECYHPAFSPQPAWRARWHAERASDPGADSEDPSRVRNLLLPARLTRLKGHRDFLAVVATLRDRGWAVRGLVAGAEDPRRRAYARRLREAVCASGLEGGVVLLGARADLREVMAVSDLVFSLSAQPESFGRTVLEALSLGRPVVGYAHGGVAEILGELFPEGAVPPGDVEAAVGAAERVLAGVPKPAIAPNLEFTLDRMLSETLALYRELIEG